MSLDATRWAWQQAIPPTRKLVLLALADRADEDHKCYPSIARLVKDTGLHRQTIMEAIKDLEESCLIVAFRKNGTGTAYQLIGVPDRHQYEKPDRSEKAYRTSTKNRTATSTKNRTENLSIEPTKNLNDLLSNESKRPRTESADHCPHQKIIDLYHKHLPMCPRVKVWNPTRQGLLRARWKEFPHLDDWEEFFKFVGKSDFLTGRAEAKQGSPPFVADLEWLIRPTNMAKIIEGKYHRSVQKWRG